MQDCAQISIPEGLAIPSYEALPSNVVRLRWRFDFAGKPTRKGVWNAQSNRVEDSAWAIDKTGLVCAAIEAEHLVTQEEYLCAECQGPDYAFFQWEAYAKMPGMGPLTGTYTPRTMIAGLTLFTRDEKLTVWVNGQWSRKPLTDDERKFQFKEHSV